MFPSGLTATGANEKYVLVANTACWHERRSAAFMRVFWLRFLPFHRVLEVFKRVTHEKKKTLVIEEKHNPDFIFAPLIC